MTEPLDTDVFDRLAAATDPAMVVVTTAADGERAGCLVGFHAQSSIEPRRYCVWLSKANHTTRVALQTTHLAIHFLSADDLDIAELFGTSTGDDGDKFARCAWRPDDRGLPLLDRCPDRLIVRRVATLDEGGDHHCLVTEPIEAHGPGVDRPLRLAAVRDLQPGHEAEERPSPPTERA